MNIKKMIEKIKPSIKEEVDRAAGQTVVQEVKKVDKENAVCKGVCVVAYLLFMLVW